MTADVETSSFDRFYNWLYPFCLEEGQKTMGMEVRFSMVFALSVLDRLQGHRWLTRFGLSF